ncbi:structural maintenance of chromosomes protein 6A-like [Benincasa hispida]|uniref:structural maintenance of chromosomes protein 6A-like n=1 Tax=Benincasa hispida TaxID=102211 RepID=UPI0018FFB0DE|nr:structural maintenance of chromosomes protein 6A-like [Benincasa hispida]
MPFNRYVKIRRIALINYGEDYGKLVVIMDVIGQNRDDAVSRKISLDTFVDFALAQGSQWILIMLHDIGMVKQGERINKQQMAALRS